MFLSLLGATVLFSITLPLLINRIESKQTQYIGLSGFYTLEDLPDEVESLVSFGLTEIEKDGTVSPSIAERWIVEDEGKTYRFVIKEGLKWQDGTDFTPEQVNYDLTDTEILATSNDVIFKLPDNFAPFPTYVAEPLLRYETSPFLYILRKKKVIGLGRYQIEDFSIHNNRLTQLVLDSPNEKRIYRFYLTEKDLLTAYKLGEIDVIPDLSSSAELEDWPNTSINSQLNKDRYLALFFNIDKPFFSKNIRQAFSYAINKEKGEKRATGPISPNSWVYLTASKSYDYDLERAIERALSELPGQPLSFTLSTLPAFEEEAEKIKQELEAFGDEAVKSCEQEKEGSEAELCINLDVNIQLKIQQFPDYDNFDALLISHTSGADPDQYTLWHSDQVGNFMQYKNTRIDSLLENGRQVIESKERKSIYQEFQQFLLEDAPAVFLEHLESFEIRRN